MPNVVGSLFIDIVTQGFAKVQDDLKKLQTNLAQADGSVGAVNKNMTSLGSMLTGAADAASTLAHS
jgi:hypothetical protein